MISIPCTLNKSPFYALLTPMLNETEILLLKHDELVQTKLEQLRQEFISINPDLKLSLDDILALVLIAPAVGVALANENMSIFEELSLENKLKQFTRRRDLTAKDDVLKAYQTVLGDFYTWENKLYHVLRYVVNFSLDKQKEVKELLFNEDLSNTEWGIAAMNAPYYLIKILNLIFLADDKNMTSEKRILPIELKKIYAIGEVIDLANMPIFIKFCSTFKLK